MMHSMRYNITVRVPQEKISYTLFAQGYKITIPKNGENNDYIDFKFLGGTTVALFYTFAEFRRAYLVTDWESETDGDKLFLPGIDSPLCLILKAKGRQIDDMKRALRWLTKDGEREAFALPMLFWQRLSALIQNGRIKKIDVMRLVKKCLEEKDEHNKGTS